MNYERIYSEFIADRLTKQPVKPEYFEKHHIVPRAHGGGNEKSNIIRLTARDHYFAHCCLAKTCGGRMWSALFAIANMTKTNGSSSYFLRGRMIDVARTKAALQRSANMTELWASGEFKRNRVYLPKPDEFKEMMRARMLGRVPSKESIEKQKATSNSKAPRFCFVRISDSFEFNGTSSEFQKLSGVSQAMTSHLCRRSVKSAKGWVLKGTDLRTLGNRDSQIRCFVNSDGREFVGTGYEFRTTFNLDSGVISNLIHGKNRVQSFKGWRCGAKENS